MAEKKILGIYPVNEIIQLFADQSGMQLELNMMKQKVWPTEVYPGYRYVNQARKIRGGSYSTGKGARSFGWRVVKATDDGEVVVMYTFNDYLRFVDMGVGAGTKYDDVDSARKAHFKRRYIRSWDRKVGRSQRPAIMMEMRHLRRRIQKFLTDNIAFKGEMIIWEALEDKDGNLIMAHWD